MKKRIFRETVISYLFLSPFMLVFIVFLGYPVFYSFYISLHKVSWSTDLFNVFSDMKYVGLKNYVKLFGDFELWWSLVTTGYYAVLSIPLGISVALGLAVLLNNNLPGRTFFRSAYFLPNVLDIFVVAIIWVFIYSPHYGILDIILSKINIHYFSEQGVLANPKTAMLGVVVALVLKGCGFGMILFLAAIQNISQSIYEAADIDGATEWQKFRFVTIPLVRPIILFMVVTGTIGALNAFTEIYAMTGGTPWMTVMEKTVGATMVSGYFLYKKWELMDYGSAAAISYILLIITLVVSLINVKLLKPK